MSAPPMYRRRRDANHSEIVDALRRMDATVCPISPTTIQEGGLPDLLVGYKGHNYLLEVKARKGKAAEVQTRWHRAWKGSPVSIVRTIPEALDVLGLTMDDLERGRCVG